MIDPAHLHTAASILKRANLGGVTLLAATAVLAIHLAVLPPEPEMWGEGEPMSSEDHAHAAVIDACRMYKGIGWALDPMAVVALAAESVIRAHEDWHRGRMQARVETFVWTAQMDRTPRHPSAEDLLDGAGVATAATDDLPEGDDGGEPEPNTDGTTEAAPVANIEAVTTPAPETSGGDPFRTEPAVPFEVSAPEPARKPRCGLPYGEPEQPCTRPAGHKGVCGEAKVVGKAKAAPTE